MWASMYRITIETLDDNNLTTSKEVYTVPSYGSLEIGNHRMYDEDVEFDEDENETPVPTVVHNLNIHASWHEDIVTEPTPVAQA